MDFIMKTLRYRDGDSVKPGILDQDGVIRDASSLVHDWDSSTITVQNLESIKSMDLSTLPSADKVDSIAPCVCKKTMGICT